MTVSAGRRCFNATITVISLVMLAIGTGTSAFEDASTSPFAPLTTYQAVASGCGGAAPAGATDTASTATATAARASSRRIRRGPYLTRSFCPTWSVFELTPGLSCSSALTVVRSRTAIEPNVSPLRTV